MEYRKIDADTFEEVVPSPKVSLQLIRSQIQDLRDQKQALVEPTNQELIDFAKLVHPYYREKENLQSQIDILQVLRDQLQLL